MNARLNASLLMFSRSLMALSAMACLCFTGCDSTSAVTKTNFDKIKPGMTAQEVEGILGKPTTITGGEAALPTGGFTALDVPEGKVGATVKTWTEGSNTAVVTFLNDKVTLTAWSSK